ncbi:hypothetical protein KEM56_001462 [Ascosphaera pollenicola]|nr:hypothetical protein KEM56_001462 [Ascosphaera pollenicola]
MDTGSSKAHDELRHPTRAPAHASRQLQQQPQPQHHHNQQNHTKLQSHQAKTPLSSQGRTPAVRPSDWEEEVTRNRDINGDNRDRRKLDDDTTRRTGGDHDLTRPSYASRTLSSNIGWDKTALNDGLRSGSLRDSGFGAGRVEYSHGQDRRKMSSNSGTSTWGSVSGRDRGWGKKPRSSRFVLDGDSTAVGSESLNNRTGSTSTAIAHTTSLNPSTAKQTSLSASRPELRQQDTSSSLQHTQGRSHHAWALGARYGSFLDSNFDKPKRTRTVQELVLPKREADLLQRRQDQSHYDARAHDLTMSGSASNGHGQTPSGQPRRASSSQFVPASVGRNSLDTESAQMVSLALKLSASRRQHNKMMGSATYSRRSSGQWPVLNGPILESSKLGDPRYNRISSAYGNTGAELYKPVPAYPPLALNTGEPLTHVATLEDELLDMQVSDATSARAEKARRHFESFAEYLRILPHLPPLNNRPVSAAPTLGEKRYQQLEGGRPYNPLQYIRNRKVRFREKSTIDTTAEGWDDVKKVRRWVDSIIENEPTSKYEPNECLNLPDITITPTEGPDPVNVPGTRAFSAAKASGLGEASKIKRPRLDWIINPADLLGDIAWLEKEDNKLKIEDKDGNRIFSRNTHLKRVNVRKQSPASSPKLHSTSIPHDENDSKRSLKRHTTFNRSGSEIRYRYSTDSSRPNIGWSQQRPNTRSQSRGRSRRRYDEPIISASDTDDEAPSRFSRFRDKLPGIRALYRSRSRAASSESEGSVSGSDISEEEVDGHHPYRRKRDRYRDYLPQIRRRSEFDGSLSVLDQLVLPHTDESDVEGELTRKDQLALRSGSSKARKRRSLLPPLDTDIEKDESDRKVVPRRGPHAPSTSVDSSDGKALRSHLTDRQRRPTHQPSVDSIDVETPSRSTLFPSITINLSPPSSRPLSSTEGVCPAVSLHSSSSTEAMTSAARESTLAKPESHDHLQVDNPSKLHSLSGSSLHRFFRASRFAGKLGHEASKVGDMIWHRDGHLHSQNSSVSSLVSLKEKDSREFSHLQLRSKHDPTGSVEDIGDALACKLDGDDGSRTPRPTTPKPVPDTQSKGADSTQPPSATKPSGKLGDDLVDPNRDRSRSPASVAEPADSQTKPKRAATDIEKMSRQSPTYNDFTDVSIPPRHRNSLLEDKLGFTLKSTPGRANLSLSKRELDRVEAHLLASGVRAHELSRQINEVDEFSASILKLIPDGARQHIQKRRRCEHPTIAANYIMLEFDKQARATHQEAMEFKRTTLPQIRSSVEKLLDLTNEKLNSNIRSTTLEADSLTSQLATTDTLAVKKLHDELDKGMRKRNNRFHWVSRNGYQALEWLLIAVMWFVWFFVMIWKIVRMIGRMALHGMRWILWL